MRNYVTGKPITEKVRRSERQASYIGRGLLKLNIIPQNQLGLSSVLELK